MKYIDETLRQLAEECIEKCKKVSEFYYALLDEERVQLSLESEYGTFVSTGTPYSITGETSWKHSILPHLIPQNDNEEQFALHFLPDHWEFISSFSIRSILFCTVLTLQASQKYNYSVRFELQALLDSFSRHCRHILKHFLDEILSVENTFLPGTKKIHKAEKNILELISSFSKCVNCVALVDNDGFVIEAIGNAEKIEHVSHNLVLFHSRAIRELHRLDFINPTCSHFSGDNTAVFIGQIKRTNLAVVISAQSTTGSITVNLLNKIAQCAFDSLIEATGRLWGEPVDPKVHDCRTRTSWFGPATLIARARYVTSLRSKLFHIPVCTTLAKSDSSQLKWFDTRSQAIHRGLKPCNTCHP